LVGLELHGDALRIHYRDFTVAPKTFVLTKERELVVGRLHVPPDMLHAIALVDPEAEPTPERWSERHSARRFSPGPIRSLVRRARVSLVMKGSPVRVRASALECRVPFEDRL
jgi:hypothetical protein